jgi:biopolymer transport protein ExbB
VQKARAAAAMQPDSSLAASIDRDELVTRAMRGEITQASARLESGLAFLASVGSTAPFVGLFGTVWGIYHALLAIASSGQVMIDKVAGPVGEALVMTAAGLAVAIPAVLAYNAFVRGNRIVLAELDGFAHDVLALVITGRRLRDQEGDALRSAVAPLAASRVVR